ncbi:mechanosensitive ion channel [Spirulina sp. CS-785/01]|uniref:mechanosensitive ion channel family protein n=1 Tax=Spirulina sp. CS-785/01 TaxID=3021716 RepID=UPI00232BDE25|nr:mechanosensitive ion channel domain-containing protein [Spirulina sp. CS-785/01]MDB9312462.1 mechanosensitive ion channel [Spirulina sp. CS-785/01]
MADNTSTDNFTNIDFFDLEGIPEIDDVPDIAIDIQTIIYAVVVTLSIIALMAFIYLIRLIIVQSKRLFTPDVADAYNRIIAPEQNRLIGAILLTIADLFLLIFPYKNFWLYYGEIALGLFASISLAWLISRIFDRLFDRYLIDKALQKKRKINSEVLIVGKLIANAVVIIAIIIIFAQTHYLNIIGLIASLGVGGLAVAFAAQKVLEQLLGGVVLYVDRPFVVDDYIGLTDGTFGRVESIGLRSTKIRTSGKGTLVVVPNNSLTQEKIENYTGAKKVISLLYITFEQIVPDEEKAFVRQIILDSTQDIFGIDTRSTGVVFKDLTQDGQQAKTQVQINFFILGSGEVAMDLRRQLLDVATQNISQQLKDYGIEFDIAERTINVDSPITI